MILIKGAVGLKGTLDRLVRAAVNSASRLDAPLPQASAQRPRIANEGAE